VEIEYGNVLFVIAAAVAAPIVAGLAPKLRLPAVALEIIIGLVLGPALLGIVEIDVPLDVLSTFGVGYLLFLAGLEIDLTTLHGRAGRIFASFGLTCVLALAAGVGVHVLDASNQALLLAIALASTSLGLVVPVLREAGQVSTGFGQTVMAASSIAEFGALLLLTLFYSSNGDSTGEVVALIVLFCILAAIVGLTVARLNRVPSMWPALERLADSSSQLSVRAVIVVLLVFLALATSLGLEAILGAFVAGALLRFLDHGDHLQNPSLKPKIEALGYGFLVPIFFVTSGVKVDLDALIEEPTQLALIPLFVLLMLVARGVPTFIAFRGLFDRRSALAGSLVQATNLTFVVIVSSVGIQTGDLDPGTAAALLAAGVISVLVYPPLAVALFPNDDELQADWDEPTDAPEPSG
jgi:Kef-type K+ transport system membrane component KefB